MFCLAIAFLSCAVVFAWDGFEAYTGTKYASVWTRLIAGFVSLCSSLFVARPETQRYYMSITPPEEVEHHQQETARLLKRLAERNRDAGNANGST